MKLVKSIKVLMAVMSFPIGYIGQVGAMEGTIQHGNPWDTISGSDVPTYLLTIRDVSAQTTAAALSINGPELFPVPVTAIAGGPGFTIFTIDTNVLCNSPGALPEQLIVRSVSIFPGAPVTVSSTRGVDC